MTPKQNFFVSFLLILIVPLFPIVLEFFSTLDCLDSTILITAAVYTITVFSTSKNLFDFVLSIVLFGILCWLYGQDVGGRKSVENATQMVAKTEGKISSVLNEPSHNWAALIAATLVILVTMYAHGQERWKRHVTKGELFFESFK